jgi:YggT family protein
LFITSIAVWLARSAIRLLEFLIFARAILSWFPDARNSRISEFLYAATEPIIQPFRSLLDRIPAMRMMPIDFSVLLAFIVLEILETLLYNLA